MPLNTYSDLRQSIKSFLGRPDDQQLPTADLIALAEADFNRRLRTHFQESTFSITIDPDAISYDLPDDFLAVREVTGDSNPIIVLEYMTPSDLDLKWPFNSTSFTQVSTTLIPSTYYTIEGSKIRFGATPISNVTVKYWAKIPPLADSSFALTAVAINTAGQDYEVGDILILEGGIPDEVALINVVTVQTADSNVPGNLNIVSGGTGYTQNDVLTLVGGTSSVVTQITIDSVDVDGVILAASITQDGDYSVVPANPISTSGGSGTGATFEIDWDLDVPQGAILSVEINEAGDYSAAPTNPVATSGGSGSGATFTFTFSGTGGSTNWLLTNYPDLYLYSALCHAEMFLGSDTSDARFGAFTQQKEMLYQSIKQADIKHKYGGSPLMMHVDGMTP